jgi:hypothetical protein
MTKQLACKRIFYKCNKNWKTTLSKIAPYWFLLTSDIKHQINRLDIRFSILVTG